MSDTSKTLTLSFGSYTCTLEGYDDPFPVFQKLTQFFQSMEGYAPGLPSRDALLELLDQTEPDGVTLMVEDDRVVIAQGVEQFEAILSEGEDQAAPEVADAGESTDNSEDVSEEAVAEFAEDTAENVTDDDTETTDSDEHGSTVQGLAGLAAGAAAVAGFAHAGSQSSDEATAEGEDQTDETDVAEQDDESAEAEPTWHPLTDEPAEMTLEEGDDAVDEIVAAADDVAEDADALVSDVTDEAEDAQDDTSEMVDEALSAASDDVEGALDEATADLDETYEDASADLDDALDAADAEISDAVEEVGAEADALVGEMSDDVDAAMDTASDQAEEALDEATAQIDEVLDNAAAQVEGTIDDAQSFVDDAIDTATPDLSLDDTPVEEAVDEIDASLAAALGSFDVEDDLDGEDVASAEDLDDLAKLDGAPGDDVPETVVLPEYKAPARDDASDDADIDPFETAARIAETEIDDINPLDLDEDGFPKVAGAAVDDDADDSDDDDPIMPTPVLKASDKVAAITPDDAMPSAVSIFGKRSKKDPAFEAEMNAALASDELEEIEDDLEDALTDATADATGAVDDADGPQKDKDDLDLAAALAEPEDDSDDFMQAESDFELEGQETPAKPSHLYVVSETELEKSESSKPQMDAAQKPSFMAEPEAAPEKPAEPPAEASKSRGGLMGLLKRGKKPAEVAATPAPVQSEPEPAKPAAIPEAAKPAPVAEPAKPAMPEPAAAETGSEEKRAGLRIIRNEPDRPAAPPAPLHLEQEDFVDDGELNLRNFAYRTNAATLTDLVEVAAAYTTLVEGQPSFSRRTVLSMIDEVAADKGYSAEVRIKSFGKLLRAGRILRVDDGQFALSREAINSFEEKLAG